LGLYECIWIRRKKNKYPYFIKNDVHNIFKEIILKIIINIFVFLFCKKYNMVHIYLIEVKRSIYSAISDNVLYFGNFYRFYRSMHIKNNTIISPNFKFLNESGFMECKDLVNCNIFRLNFDYEGEHYDVK